VAARRSAAHTLAPRSNSRKASDLTQVHLYDTTLRDGMQGQGMSLSAAEKVRVVRALDRLGVHFIEAGFPSSNPKEEELFRLLSDVELEAAAVCAFGMTRRRGIAAEEDDGLRTLVASFAPVSTLVGKTWALHLEKVTKVSRDENLAMIIDSVSFCRGHGKRVVYDAEHFFDAWREDSGYAMECLRAAVTGGAENVTLCDTNGASLPGEVAGATASVVAELGDRVEIGIHTHNDAEVGVANSLAAVEAGARMVQGTINGVGERCGNANLVSILPALQLKMGLDCVPGDRMGLLTETAHFLNEICNLSPDPDQPYVGRNAFAHKGGMHVAGIQADARTFEHLDPELVGNSRDVLISELSGKGSVVSRAERAGIELDADAAKRAVERVKEREHRGYHYEAADASFELLLRRESGDYVPLFRLESFRVITEKRADGRVETEATIKLWVEGQRHVRTAEGNGPVNALDRALRSAITELHPHLADIELVNYKVRILDEHQGTGAVTRVLLDSSDGHGDWGTIGVSENIIEASWEALVESLEYAFQPRTPPAASSAPAQNTWSAATPRTSDAAPASGGGGV
jgi:2-isopropylmalate synthase